MAEDPITSAPAGGAKLPGPVLLFDRPAVRELLTLPECIEAVASAFRAHAQGASLAPGLLHVEADDGEFHIKAGGVRRYFACKVNGGFFNNRHRHGLPNIVGLILLSDAATGRPLALMESGLITALRTGAATAIAARLLARTDTDTVTICGAGSQAEIQLRALAHAMPGIRRAHIWSRSDPWQFAARMSRELRLDVVHARDLGAAARSSQVIVTCTPAKAWFLGRQHVSPGKFVAAVGADSPDKQEIEPALLADAAIVCDLTEQCSQVGELHHALAAGVVRVEQVRGELGAILNGQIVGRRNDSEIVVFDSTGTALQDVAAASAVYERALQQGYSTAFAFWR